ncbi:abortive infection system antitoxin AbiGi family protein [Streptomyces sp. NBC_00989]|uniref:abortive infection system antitoxin AbiGi family protein n=1 Tax=Streptomyces sp. NBC_00989 TaxID=2903705 RepID=UPI002F914B6B|nr:abortive infection system antitoxin AbiGi family protein [Streptomyces sp. NBC_00989]
MPSIEALLHRRTDLSAFVVHFTRATAGDTASDNLKAILRDRSIEARNVFGMARDLAAKHEAVADTQRTVCFTETPLEHAWMMCEQIPNRTMKFNGYGLAFTRTFVRRRGANPVWYLDMTPGHDFLTNPIDNMVDEVLRIAGDSSEGGVEAAAKADILRLTPFIETMGKPRETRKEFWWEREWRHVSDFDFDFEDLVVVFAPEKEHDEFEDHLGELKKRGRLPKLVDASWGLERMIAALARVSEPGPFPR